MAEPTPDEVVQALHRALNDVSDQIPAMPMTELLGDEDLDWSFDGPDTWWVLGDAKRRDVTLGRLTVAVIATARSRCTLPVRARQSRDLTVSLESAIDHPRPARLTHLGHARLIGADADGPSV